MGHHHLHEGQVCSKTTPLAAARLQATSHPGSYLQPIPSSRLGCQVIAAKDLDGLRVKLPSATRNFYVSEKGEAAQAADSARLAAASAAAAALRGDGGSGGSANHS